VEATTLDLWRGDFWPSKKVNIFRSVPIGGLKFLTGVRMALKPPPIPLDIVETLRLVRLVRPSRVGVKRFQKESVSDFLLAPQGQKNVYSFIVAPLTVRWRNNKNTYTLPGIIDIHGVVMLIKWD
jgi:hypothetical protein